MRTVLNSNPGPGGFTLSPRVNVTASCDWVAARPVTYTDVMTFACDLKRAGKAGIALLEAHRPDSALSLINTESL